MASFGSLFCLKTIIHFGSLINPGNVLNLVMAMILNINLLKIR
jgi:hypothetical protein